MKTKHIMLEIGTVVASVALARYTKPAKPEKMLISADVLDQIKNTVGAMEPEQGGMLGGDPDTGVITSFHFDSSARTSGGTYSPDSEELTRLLKKEWNPAGVRLMGFVHSHPDGFYRLSGGDTAYAARILQHNPEMKRLLLPIIRPSRRGTFKMHPYAVVSDPGGGVTVKEMETEVIMHGHPVKWRIPATESPVAGPALFARVKDAYDLERLRCCRVVCVGAGGAAGFVEDMVRAGVGEHVLIDPDTVSGTNISTQATYIKDIGRPKVEALAERLSEINPSARICTHSTSLEDISDADFGSLLSDPMGGASPVLTLIAGLTDSFAAQARVNALALHFGAPSICAQVYQEGRGAEVTFTYPGVTPACHRCILSSRYRAYLSEGYRNQVTSDGTPIFSTTRLNALKGFIAMAVLHHGTDHTRWGGMLNRIGKRNLAQIRMDPDLPLGVFARTFGGGDTERILFDETVWLPQEAESFRTGCSYDCPDCGGTGDLRAAVGSFADTREIRPCVEGDK